MLVRSMQSMQLVRSTPHCSCMPRDQGGGGSVPGSTKSPTCPALLAGQTEEKQGPKVRHSAV